MALPVSAAQSQQKTTLNPLLQFKTPEEAIFATRTKWLEELNQIPEDQRESYRIGISLVVQELKDKSTILKSQGLDALQIVAQLNQTAKLYNTSYALFAQRAVSYEQQQLREKDQNLSLTDKLCNEVRSFSVYHTPAKTPTDPYKAQSQFEALVVLGVAHTAGAVLRGAGALVTEGAKKVCKVTTTTETACRAVHDGGMAVINATGLPKAVEYVQREGSEYLAGVLEERYEFPKEQAKELGYNTINDALVVGTVGGTALASNFVLKNCFKPKPAAAAAEKPTSTASAPPMGMGRPFFLDRGGGFSLETHTYYAFIPDIPETVPPTSGTQTLTQGASSTQGTQTSFNIKSSQTASQATSAISGKQAPSVVEPGQEIFQLGRANKIQTLYKDFNDHIQSNGVHQTMDAAIDTHEKILNYLTPTLSAEVKKTVERIKNSEMTSGDHAKILTDTNNRFIRKEFHSFNTAACEFMGLQFSRSLGLKNTVFAEPLAFWTHGEQGTLVKSFLSGHTPQDWMYAVGRLPKDSRERIASVMHLERMAFSMGKSTGEHQAKGSHLPPLSESELNSAVGRTIRDMGEVLGDADNQLDIIGKKWITEPDEFLVPVYQKFEANPDPVSFGVGSNIVSADFLYNPEATSPLACLTTQYVPTIINSQGRPNLFISQEPAFFRSLLLCDGYEAGLEFSEIRSILQAYNKGLRTEYQGPAPSQAGVELHDLYSSLRSIRDSSASLRGTGDLRMYRLIDSQIKYFDQQLHAYSQSTTAAK